MFYYREEKWSFFIKIDKSSWEYGPFSWVYVKNKYLWDINKSLIDDKKYPWYKYSFWVWNDYLFIIWLEGLEDLIKITS